VIPAVLANTVALIHALLIALVIGGALVATTPRVIPRFPRWLVVAYLVSVGLTLLSDLFFGDCLMTVWEKALRDQAAPGSAYGETFLQHYFGFLPHSFTQPGHFAPGLGVILGVTAWAILQLRRRAIESTHPSPPPPAGPSP
jgi:cytochrome c biogenesis protein CcdA